MEHIKVTLPVTPERLEDVTAELTAMGWDSFQIEDERDVLAQVPNWDMTDEALLEHYRGACRILLYVPLAANTEEALDALREQFPDMVCETIREEDWADNWKQYYEPILIGERLVIHPEWLEQPDYGSRAVYLSNPGCSFGTGLHASTRLCLHILEAMDVTGRKVLDIGAGSGILSISALLLGAREAVAADIDPLSADIARCTAMANGVGERYRTFAGDYIANAGLRESAGEGFDVVFSNIVADVILALLPHVPPRMAAGGVWIVSGILTERADEVVAAAKDAGLSVTEQREEAGWSALAFTATR